MHFAVWGRVDIFRNDTDDIVTETLVVGKFRMSKKPEDSHHRRMIGLAGTIAKELDEDPEICGWEIFEWLAFQTIELSASDAELAGEYTEADVEECLELLRSVWSSVDMVAKHEAERFMMDDTETDT
jgi:hypothetical protein